MVTLLNPDVRRAGPAKESGPQEIAPATSITILPPATLTHPKAVLPGYAVFVMRRDERWHRQIFVSLHSAQKAINRAAEKGIEARCQLVEIVPVPSVPMVVVGGECDG